MNTYSRIAVAVFASAMLLGPRASQAETWRLGGDELTIDEVVGIARDPDAEVQLDEAAVTAVAKGFDLVMEAALQGKAVYGLTVGVGWNKDRPVFETTDGERVLTDELLELSRNFNLMS